MAERIGISVSRMNDSFREAAGETPIACLRRYRLAEVARMLVSTDGTVESIAEVTGFRSGKALHKAWMAVHDLPPRQWRMAQHPPPAG